MPKTIYVAQKSDGQHFGFPWSRKQRPGFFKATVTGDAAPGLVNTAAGNCHTIVRVDGEVK